jgi:hypothetical protein
MSFDKLGTNGAGFVMRSNFPFVVSQSNHAPVIFGILSYQPLKFGQIQPPHLDPAIPLPLRTFG